MQYIVELVVLSYEMLKIIHVINVMEIPNEWSILEKNNNIILNVPNHEYVQLKTLHLVYMTIVLDNDDLPTIRKI